MTTYEENETLPSEFRRFLSEETDVPALNCSAGQRQLAFYAEDNVGNKDVVVQLAAFAAAALASAKNDPKIDAAVDLVADPELRSYMKKIRDNFKKM